MPISVAGISWWGVLPPDINEFIFDSRKAPFVFYKPHSPFSTNSPIIALVLRPNIETLSCSIRNFKPLLKQAGPRGLPGK